MYSSVPYYCADFNRVEEKHFSEQACVVKGGWARLEGVVVSSRLQLLSTGGSLVPVAALCCSSLNTLLGFNFPFDFLSPAEMRWSSRSLQSDLKKRASFLTFPVQRCFQEFVLFSLSDHREQPKKKKSLFLGFDTSPCCR